MANPQCKLSSKSRGHPQQGLVGHRQSLNYFSQYFTGKARRVEGCTNCGPIKHETTECPRKKGKRPAREDIKAQPPKQKQKPDVCFNWNYKCPCQLSPCPYKHKCIKCSPEDHQFLDCPKRLKKEGPMK